MNYILNLRNKQTTYNYEKSIIVISYYLSILFLQQC